MPSGTLPQTTAPRPASRQAADLARWLETRTVAPARAVASSFGSRAEGSRTELPAARKDMVKPLREALAEQGLGILPDPLHRFPCAKVVRVSDLL